MNKNCYYSQWKRSPKNLMLLLFDDPIFLLTKKFRGKEEAKIAAEPRRANES